MVPGTGFFEILAGASKFSDKIEISSPQNPARGCRKIRIFRDRLTFFELQMRVNLRSRRQK